MIRRRSLLLGVAAGALAIPAAPEIEAQAARLLFTSAARTFFISEETIVNLALNREALKAEGFVLLPWQRMWARYA